MNDHIIADLSFVKRWLTMTPSRRHTLCTRREFCGAVAASAVWATSPPVANAAAAPAFRHRGYLGWITDLARRGEPQVAWPSMRLDDELLEDYAETCAALARSGFNELVVWGLYINCCKHLGDHEESASLHGRGRQF